MKVLPLYGSFLEDDQVVEILLLTQFCYNFVSDDSLVGSTEISDKGTDNLKREQRMPALCVICLEHDYNAVFVP